MFLGLRHSFIVYIPHFWWLFKVPTGEVVSSSHKPPLTSSILFYFGRLSSRSRISSPRVYVKISISGYWIFLPPILVLPFLPATPRYYLWISANPLSLGGFHHLPNILSLLFNRSKAQTRSIFSLFNASVSHPNAREGSWGKDLEIY